MQGSRRFWPRDRKGPRYRRPSGISVRLWVVGPRSAPRPADPGLAAVTVQLRPVGEQATLGRVLRSQPLDIVGEVTLLKLTRRELESGCSWAD